MSQASLLVEIGCEELPAGSVLPLAQGLGQGLAHVLEEAGFRSATAAGVSCFATPRRIAARIPEVLLRQPDQIQERRGPAVSAAFDDQGEPTRALQGFLGSAGIALEALQRVSTDKGEWVMARIEQPGRALADALQGLVEEVVKNLPAPRRMRWGNTSHEFLRPVRWIVALHGEQVVPLELFGIQSSNQTRGHRFHAPESVSLDNEQVYEQTLRARKVIADFAERRELIRQDVNAMAVQRGGTVLHDEDLLDEVTALVEWPVVLGGRFDETFLDIPAEALVQTMQDNQRYFALADAQGKLLPAFITVSNIDSSAPETVISGNERVIRPRFADTMFFWQQDKSHTLAARAAELDTLLFQEKLGSVADKQTRMTQALNELAPMFGAEVTRAQQAAQLCKADLCTEIVKELPGMQGIAGRYYAEREGLPQDVALALEEHYFPKGAGAALPQNPVAQALAVADKLDTLVGIYGQGLIPSGTRDPFGLRRASIGVLRIILEGQHAVNLDQALEATIRSFRDRLPDIDRVALRGYINERLRGLAIEQGHAPEVVDAVLAVQPAQPLDALARMQAMESFNRSAAAPALAAASKRIGNILKKQSHSDTTVQSRLLVDPAEQALHDLMQSLAPEIENHLAAGRYTEAMTRTATLREPVDRFFDEVMVMVDEDALRQNRLSLLARLADLCNATADLSVLRS